MAKKSILLNRDFVDNFQTMEPVYGFTHNLYQYPARFSPLFVRSLIKDFTKPGDLVLDPFMGSGTTLIEALVSGRESFGVDVNPIAALLAKTKTTIFLPSELSFIMEWWSELRPKIRINDRISTNHDSWIQEGYDRNLPWRLRKVIGLLLDRIEEIPKERLKNLAKCVLLSTGKWALEAHDDGQNLCSFYHRFESNLHEAIKGSLELRTALQPLGRSKVVTLHGSAKDIKVRDLKKFESKSASIVITSPPYPGVHILYHRWQINGSKETAAPYWIIGSPDGHGEGFYTLGGRSKKGIDRYFHQIHEIYSNLRPLLRDGAMIFQMVAFSDIKSQLPRFDEAMVRAGYRNINIKLNHSIKANKMDYLTRRVPLRKWYANLQGDTDSSLEHLVVHQKI